ncbi:S-layer homology domain-containing protein [Peptoniphilus catoniae]|uniref:S-layer homology domain-containing protein n=1 Tax=Peptoniphilus catoniae TaxID=1660341 RepID=UPI0015D6232C|nr:S-layer homology domain-containing protein [Peptoniphilus catoniae]
MERFKSIFALTALIGIFLFPIRAVAEAEPAKIENPNHFLMENPIDKEISEKGQVNSHEIVTPNNKESENKVEKPVNEEIEVLNPYKLEEAPLKVPTPVRGGDKAFTVTKRPLGDTGDGTLVGEYDTLYDAVDNCPQDDLSNEYIITLNKDWTIPADEHCYGRSNTNMILRSAPGQQYTLTREGNRDFIDLHKKMNLRTENIILDGHSDGQFTLLADESILTLGKGTVVQNCVGTPNYDGPAILMQDTSTLNIEDDVIIQNNTSNQAGGAIQAQSGTTVNISGGSFKNNSTTTSDGGFLAAYGNLNITGGAFENNSAAKTSGAILIGSNSVANIENATFKNNKASTGGAIYAMSEPTIKRSTFTANEANWGGGIFAAKNLSLDGVTFANNSVSKQGGALYLSAGATINNSSFTENTSAKQGGGIYLTKGNLTLSNSTFSKNDSENGGGAIFIVPDSNSISKVSESEFTDNTGLFGGGIYLGRNSKLEVERSKFKNNEAAYGAGISSAASAEGIDTSLTNININSSEFAENKALLGAGLFTAFPTEINETTFSKNYSDVHPSDIQDNPHESGCGGALYVMDQKTLIKKSSFIENSAFGSGGAICINGVKRDKTSGEVTEIKPDAMVKISDNTEFKSNRVKVGQGGAIYAAPYEYAYKITDKDAYKKLITDDTTLFVDNSSGEGLFNPPTNFEDFTNLKYSDKSDVIHEILTRKSLLNNYDVNYKSDSSLIIYDANGGNFEDGSNKKTEEYKIGEEIKIINGPTRPGYKFLYWESPQYNPGDSYTVAENHIFTAKWEKLPDKPDKPVEPERPEHEGFAVGSLWVKSNNPSEIKTSEIHKAYIKGYPDGRVMPQGNMTRAEAVAVITRLEGYSLNNEDATTFSDTKAEAWYNKYINAAFAKGILVEKAGEAFRPDEPITRAELARLIAPLDKKNTLVAPFADVKGHLYEDAINQAYGNNRIEGYPDGSFRPDESITRSEVATMLNRFYSRKADAKSFDSVKNIEILKDFTDLQKDHWAYYEIMEAANSHEYIRREEKSLVENWLYLLGDMVN